MLVVTLLLALLVSAVGVSVALVVDIELMTSSNHRDRLDVQHVAEGAIDLAIQELSLLSDWTPVLNGSIRSTLSGDQVLPPAAGGTALDVAATTATLQQSDYGGMWWGADTPRWQLYGYGVAGTDLPVAGLPDNVYVLIWLSDDVADDDGNPLVDDNGVVVIRARAIGVRNSQSDAQAVVARTAVPGVIHRVSSRVLR